MDEKRHDGENAAPPDAFGNQLRPMAAYEEALEYYGGLLGKLQEWAQTAWDAGVKSAGSHFAPEQAGGDSEEFAAAEGMKALQSGGLGGEDALASLLDAAMPVFEKAAEPGLLERFFAGRDGEDTSLGDQGTGQLWAGVREMLGMMPGIGGVMESVDALPGGNADGVQPVFSGIGARFSEFMTDTLTKLVDMPAIKEVRTVFEELGTRFAGTQNALGSLFFGGRPDTLPGGMGEGGTETGEQFSETNPPGESASAPWPEPTQGIGGISATELAGLTTMVMAARSGQSGQLGTPPMGQAAIAGVNVNFSMGGKGGGGESTGTGSGSGTGSYNGVNLALDSLGE